VNLALPIGDTVTEKFGLGASMAVSEHDFFCRDRRADAKGAQAQQTAQKSLARALQMDEEKTAAMVIKGSPEAVQAASKAAK
jgi:competence protein ComGF